MYSQISPTGDGALSMFGEVTAKGLRERYTIRIFKPDPNYVYLDMIPRRVTDSARIKQLRVALYGPNVKAPHTPYVPSQVFILRTNGDSEIWTFKESEWNVKRVDEQSFAFVPIPGWKVIRGAPDKSLPLPPRDGAAKP
jgi:TIGR03009 family protein